MFPSNKTAFLLLSCTIALPLTVQASDDLYSKNVSVGNASGGIDTFRLGFRKDVSYWFEQRDLPFKGYIEASGFVWNSPVDEVYGLGLTVAASYEFTDKWKFKPYVEYGFGVALISDTTIGERNMSSAFQFENRLGFGFRSENIDIFARAEHFSNAGIQQPNEGIDIFSVGVSFKF